jgi:SAM-dependent methyltransferase
VPPGASVKHNVALFDEDAASGGYLYTDLRRYSTRVSAARMTEGILAATEVRGRSVLDLGCGDGAYSLEIARAGARRVLGLDAAPRAVQLARERAKAAGLPQLEFAVADICALALGERFDVVVMRGVLHHLPDPAGAVKAAARSATRMVILEPNGCNPVLKAIERLSPYHREHEEQSFLPSTVKSWVRAAGGHPRTLTMIGLVPVFCPEWLGRICKTLEPLVERVPVLRTVACGQFVLMAELPEGSPSG